MSILQRKDASFLPTLEQAKCPDIVFFFLWHFRMVWYPSCFRSGHAITFEVNRLISGRMKMYVDDMFGVSLRSKVEDYIQIASSVCCRLFQSECIEEMFSKWLPCEADPQPASIRYDKVLTQSFVMEEVEDHSVLWHNCHHLHQIIPSHEREYSILFGS
jgi:hypothetical protein